VGRPAILRSSLARLGGIVATVDRLVEGTRAKIAVRRLYPHELIIVSCGNEARVATVLSDSSVRYCYAGRSDHHVETPPPCVVHAAVLGRIAITGLGARTPFSCRNAVYWSRRKAPATFRDLWRRCWWVWWIVMICKYVKIQRTSLRCVKKKTLGNNRQSRTVLLNNCIFAPAWPCLWSGGTVEEHSLFHDAPPGRTIRCSP